MNIEHYTIALSKSRTSTVEMKFYIRKGSFIIYFEFVKHINMNYARTTVITTLNDWMLLMDREKNMKMKQNYAWIENKTKIEKNKIKIKTRKENRYVRYKEIRMMCVIEATLSI